MDALKFAFEILIVGALALPWLAILIRMFVDEPVAEDRKAPDPRHPWRRPPTDDGPFHLSVVPESVRSAVAAAFVVAIGYLLGSSVSRISRDFFNNDLLLRGLPTEDRIRDEVYRHEYCTEDVLNAEELPVKGHKRLPKSLCGGITADPGTREGADQQVGSISDDGVYIAPTTVSSPLTVTVTATSSERVGTAEITLSPPAVEMSPSTATLTAGQKLRFMATLTPSETKAPALGVPGSAHALVSWMINPSRVPAENREVENKNFSRRVKEMFLLQESDLLLNGQDKVDRLKQFYDQINVLRGAAFNGFILFFLCLFGCGRNAGHNRRHRPFKLIAFSAAGFLVICGAISLLNHWRGRLSFYNEPPLGELVLLLLGVGGFFVIRNAKRDSNYGVTCAIASVLTLISFGGWWWTEIMYNLQVIHSQPELLVTPGSSSSNSRASAAE